MLSVRGVVAAVVSIVVAACSAPAPGPSSSVFLTPAPSASAPVGASPSAAATLQPSPSARASPTAPASPTGGQDPVIAQIETGRGPCAITELDGQAWVTNYSDGTLTRIAGDT